MVDNNGRLPCRRMFIAGVLFVLAVATGPVLASGKDLPPRTEPTDAMMIFDIISIDDAAVFPGVPMPVETMGRQPVIELRVRLEVVDSNYPTLLEIYLRHPSGLMESHIGTYGFYPPAWVGEEREIRMPISDPTLDRSLFDGSEPPHIVVRLFRDKSQPLGNKTRLRVLHARFR